MIKLKSVSKVHYVDRKIIYRSDFGPQMEAEQLRLIEEAYEWLFNSAIIIAKMHIVEKTLKILNLTPKSIPDKDITNFPTILQHIAWMYNHAGDSD